MKYSTFISLLCFVIFATGTVLGSVRIPDPFEMDPMADLNISSIYDLIDESEPLTPPETRLFLYPRLGEHMMQILQAQIRDDFAYYQGDIALGHRAELTDCTDDEGLKAGANKILVAGYGLAGLDKSIYLWPKGVIPYTIDDSLKDSTDIIVAAIEEWNQKTNITLVHYELEKSWLKSNFKNYDKMWRIHFKDTDGKSCFSYVGLRETNQHTDIERAQVISLVNNCTHLTALHEIGHTIGLWHEHNRPDRDGFIKIMSDNIQENNRDQYDVGNNNTAAMIGDYDYESIMHYRDNCFAIGDGKTFEALRYDSGQTRIGRVQHLSTGDIDAVNAMYKTEIYHRGEFIVPTVENDESDSFEDSGSHTETSVSSYTGSGTTTGKPTNTRKKKTTFTDEENKMFAGLVAQKLPSDYPKSYTKIAAIESKMKTSNGMTLIECALTLAEPDNPSKSITYVGTIHSGTSGYYVMYVKKK
jgi:hypothetical protein